MHKQHNAAGSRDSTNACNRSISYNGDHGSYRYFDTRDPNGDALRKCILKGPYTPTIVTTPVVPATGILQQFLNKQQSRLQLKKMGKPLKATTVIPATSSKDKGTCRKILALISKSASRNSTILPTTTSELPQTPETRMWILLQGIRMTIRLDFWESRAGNVVGVRKLNTEKPKGFKDSRNHKEKMLLCKQAEKGVQLQAEQSDWLADTDEEY
ncbi:hypothetical protein Tco_0855942 [Tanacetum coccineum]